MMLFPFPGSTLDLIDLEWISVFFLLSLCILEGGFAVEKRKWDISQFLLKRYILHFLAWRNFFAKICLFYNYVDILLNVYLLKYIVYDIEYWQYKLYLIEFALFHR
jgi:hypothetical protein